MVIESPEDINKIQNKPDVWVGCKILVILCLFYVDPESARIM